MTNPIDILSDPSFAEYLRKAMTAQPGPGFDEALQKDQAARDNAGVVTGLSQASALLRNQNVPTLQPHPQDEALKAWVARQAATDRAQDNALKPLEIAARFRALKANAAPGPAPRAVLEALGSRGVPADVLDTLNEKDAMDLFKQKPDKAETRQPPTAEQIARGKAFGLMPAADEDSVHYEVAIRNAEKDATGKGDKAGERSIDLETKLRQEYQGQQTYKDSQNVAAMYRKVKTAGQTGAGDISLIFGYMKLLDPGSTVREGEYATAANAGSVPQSIIAHYNKIVSGEKLAPAVRDQFRTEARNVYNAQMQQLAALSEPYRALAKSHGINPSHVVPDYKLDEEAAPAQRKTVNGKTYEKRGADWFEVTP